MSLGVIASHDASGGAGSAYDAAILALSPLFYWKLDETSGAIIDYSGNSRSPTIVGAVTGGATKVRPNGVNAFDFPGATSAYLTLSSAAWMQQASFTIAGWIQMDSTTSYRCIWSRDVNGAGTRGPSLYVTSGKLNLFSSADNLGTATLSTGTNYFVVATYDSATSTLVYYIDGAVDRTLTSVSMPNSGAYEMLVGVSYAASPSKNFPFDGRVDDLAYFGSVLTAPQVAALFAAA